jgi:hypothetical protein
VVLTGGKTRPAPPVLRAPARPPATVAKEKGQPASDNLNVPQDTLSKFDLGLELTNITRCGGRHYAAANGILKATKRGINKIHWAPTQKTGSNDPDTTNFRIKPSLSNPFPTASAK